MPANLFQYPNQEGPEKKSKYNSAIAQLYRLDFLWQEAHKSAREISYSKWNEVLDRIWLELSADANKEQIQVFEKIQLRCQKLFLYSSTVKLRKMNPALYSKLFRYQKEILMSKETFLRILLNNQGKGAAYEETVEDYMDDGF